MPDLRTTWMGLSLPTPVVLGASPLAHDVEAVAAAVAAGAGAVVMYSLFEEQVVNEQMAAHHFIDARMDADAEAAGFLPDVDVFSLGAEPDLAQLQRLKERVAVPVIASLNGVTPGGWTEYARACEVRGADALELNLYDVVTSAEENAHRVEERQLEVVHAVVHAVDIPVTVKIGPAYTSVPAFVRRLKLSTPAELPQRLHALAVLSPTAAVALACTGGVHSGHDAAKALLCGAHVVQVTSAVLQHGPGQLRPIVDGLRAWLAETGYVSSDEARGVLAMGSTRDASVWERLNYVRMLDGWRMERVPRG